VRDLSVPYHVAQPIGALAAVSMALPVRKDRKRAAYQLIAGPLSLVGPAT